MGDFRAFAAASTHLRPLPRFLRGFLGRARARMFMITTSSTPASRYARKIVGRDRLV